MRTTPAPAAFAPAELDRLAAAVAADGAAAHHRAVGRLAVVVRSVLGPTRRTDVAIDVMLDPHAPDVVRSRAFGLVSAALGAAPTAAVAHRRDLAA